MNLWVEFENHLGTVNESLFSHGMCKTIQCVSRNISTAIIRVITASTIKQITEAYELALCHFFPQRVFGSLISASVLLLLPLVLSLWTFLLTLPINPLIFNIKVLYLIHSQIWTSTYSVTYSFVSVCTLPSPFHDFSLCPVFNEQF